MFSTCSVTATSLPRHAIAAFALTALLAACGGGRWASRPAADAEHALAWGVGYGLVDLNERVKALPQAWCWWRR